MNWRLQTLGQSIAELLPWIGIFLVIWVIVFARIRRQTNFVNRIQKLELLDAASPSRRKGYLFGGSLILAVGAVFSYSGNDLIGGGLNLLGLAIAAGLGWIVPLLRQRKYQRILLANNFLNCLRCGYYLKGLESRGICPECGESFELANLERLWREIAGLK